MANLRHDLDLLRDSVGITLVGFVRRKPDPEDDDLAEDLAQWPAGASPFMARNMIDGKGHETDAYFDTLEDAKAFLLATIMLEQGGGEP